MCLLQDDMTARAKSPERFGFHQGEPDGDHIVGQTSDDRWNWQIQYIPHMSSGPGLPPLLVVLLVGLVVTWWVVAQGI